MNSQELRQGSEIYPFN